MGGVSHLFAPSGKLQELIADGSAFPYQPWSCSTFKSFNKQNCWQKQKTTKGEQLWYLELTA